MIEIQSPKRCGLFKPGHEVHFLQGLRSGNDLINPRLPGEFIEVREDGTISVEVDGQELFFWNHEPERIDEAVFFGGSKIAYQPKWGLLYVPSSQGNYAFFVAESLEDHLPCPAEPPVGTAPNNLSIIAQSL